MPQADKPKRQNRPLTLDFHDQAPSFELLSDGKAFVELVLAFILSLGFPLTPQSTCHGGGGRTRHSHNGRVRLGGLSIWRIQCTSCKAVFWRRFPLVVMRSVWDYHLKANRFREWVSTFLEHPGQLWNPPAGLLGNMNKNEAKEILTGTQGPLLYARVDAVEREGRLVLMELELNEPYLFLSYSTAAPVRFAEKIIDMVERIG